MNCISSIVFSGWSYEFWKNIAITTNDHNSIFRLNLNFAKKGAQSVGKTLARLNGVSRSHNSAPISDSILLR